jgi:DNA invertase Pin-like site-specific DNA recombinase
MKTNNDFQIQIAPTIDLVETKFPALIYSRVSSIRQTKEGHGLDSQEHRCREYADNKKYEVEKVFPDSFSGGGDFMNRPAMREMLEYIDAHAHKQYVVIFDDLKRFARDTEFHLKLRSAFKSRNTRLECLNYKFEDTPEGRFVETIFAAQGELEREQNRRQVIQKMRARLERGYWPFFPPPGYKAEKDAVHGMLLKPKDPKASIIKEALEGFASGRFQEQIDVQKFLQLKDFAKGRRIHLETVRRLLERVIYAGYIEYPKWEIIRRKGHHEALINLETYEKIMEKLDGRARSFTRIDTREDFPLRGFVQCEHCKKLLTASWSTGRNGRFPYYRCTEINCSQKNKSLNSDEVHKKFKIILKGVKPKKTTLNATREILLDMWNDVINDTKGTHDQVETRLAAITAQIAVLLKRIDKTTSEKMVEIYEAQVEDLSKEEQVLKDKLQNSTKRTMDFGTALDFVFSILENPYATWEDGDLAMKRLVLKLVFEKNIAYSKNSGFGTAILSLPLRVFETFDASNSLGVEHCEGR